MLPNEYPIDRRGKHPRSDISKSILFIKSMHFHTDITNFQLIFVNLFYIYLVGVA